jgi:hypothetical protein
MTPQVLSRWEGLVIIAAALLFAVGSVLLVVLPTGHPVGALLHFIGFVLAAPAYMALYAVQSRQSGKLGFAGFVLGVIGAVLYAVPVFLVFAGSSGVETWHDSYLFASPLLVIGALAFLIGSILLGIVTMRAQVLPRWAGLLLALGYFLWLIAFWVAPAAFLLQVGTVVGGIGLIWMGWTIFAGKAGQPERAA